MNNKEKQVLRRQIFAQRRAIPTAYRMCAQLAIVKHIQSLPCFKKARRFASFIATGSEIDAGSLAYTSNKQTYVPVISRYKTGEMCFAPIAQSFIDQQTNAFGIVEPKTMHSLPLFLLDVIIVPLVAFDNSGNRLGMGGGYYDRMLTRIRHISQQIDKPIHTIGVAFSLQQVARVPCEAHDARLSFVVTEMGIHNIMDANQIP